MLRPPRHRVDAKPALILAHDTAWDKERIEAEKAKMKEQGLDPAEHPVEKYWRGDTRYDLHAKCPILGEAKAASDYLRGDVAPTIFHLRRLDSREQWRRVESYWQAGAIFEGADLAARYCLARVENLEIDLAGPPGELTTEDMDKLHALRFFDGDQLVDPLFLIGLAGYRASRPLREDEKKASG